MPYAGPKYKLTADEYNIPDDIVLCAVAHLYLSQRALIVFTVPPCIFVVVKVTCDITCHCWVDTL